MMGWSDAVRVAGRDVVRRRGRVALTVMAVALAATLLTALLLIAETARSRVLDQLAKGGPLAGIRVASEVDSADVARMRALPDVVAVLPLLTTDVVAVPDAESLRMPEGTALRLVGADLNDPGKLPITLLSGRLPLAGSSTEVALTQSYLERLGLAEQDAAGLVGGEVALGSVRPAGGGRMVIRSTRAKVVGIVAQEAAPGDVVAPLSMVESATSWARGRPTPTYDGAFVVATELDRVASARQGLTGLGFTSSAPENLIASVQRYLRIVEIVLASIGAIALVIAGLGIANALFASVRERRREIGVLKAIGARDRDIRRIFLAEATALGVTGGALGTLLGWGVSLVVGSVVNSYLASYGLGGVQVQLQVGVIITGVLGSTVLALVAGTVPAVRAAHLPARQALGEA